MCMRGAKNIRYIKSRINATRTTLGSAKLQKFVKTYGAKSMKKEVL